MKPISDGTLLFTGDSITDAGRERPLGSDYKDTLGDGYVARAAAILQATRPELRLRVLNTGVAGNTSLDLAGRWDDDVLIHRPDWLSVMIGVNDALRPLSRPAWPASWISPERYEATLGRLLRRSRPRLRGLLLLAPFVIEAGAGGVLRQSLAPYQAAVHRLARTHDAVLVDTQAVIDRLLAADDPLRLGPDRVHPRQAGHMAIALQVVRALEATPVQRTARRKA